MGKQKRVAQRDKKRVLSQYWDKTFHPAVPPKLTQFAPAHFTHHHAHRPDNGYGPRQLLLALRLSAALVSPFTKALPVAIPPPATLFAVSSLATPLTQWFFLWIVLYPTTLLGFCQEGFCQVDKIPLAETMDLTLGRRGRSVPAGRWRHRSVPVPFRRSSTGWASLRCWHPWPECPLP